LAPLQEGAVVRFQGCRVGCLVGGIVRTLEIPLSAGMQSYLAAGSLQEALEASIYNLLHCADANRAAIRL